MPSSRLGLAQGRVTFWYFPVVDLRTSPPTDAYDDVMGCVVKSGWRACTHLAEKWLDQPIPSTA